MKLLTLPIPHCFPLLSYSVLLREGTSTLLSSSSTTNFGLLPTDAPPVGPTNQNQTNRVPLAVGLTLGLIALVIAVLGSVFYLYRRRRWTQLHSDAYRLPPYTDQPLGLPQVDKRPPSLARLPGTPMATGDPGMPSNVSGLGPPPGYESPMYGRRVDPE